ncbi:MarR family winged helix-turn-helix transcriptional regulator [Streptomyces fradiae]|uniref:MarR family winged helix-turn-helix transcriptional regulator n=1 Tax=Streptomyces fradiae TaxID=1906 RepID=UPI00294275BB|nr:MarR family transcriptional regulator [Streptomyces fradiae]WOI62956.1 MarR family transcriptional regulator [Streptomyces fradiae]
MTFTTAAPTAADPIKVAPAPADPAVKDENLAAQPIGYWSGVVHQAVIRHLRDAMADLDLTQPLWWTLNRLAAAGPGGASREELAAGLAPLADDPDEIPRIPARLAHRGWTTEDEAGVLRLTGEGAAAHARMRAVAADVRARLHEGVSDEEYAAALRVLRRIARNAEGGSGGDAGDAGA